MAKEFTVAAARKRIAETLGCKPETAEVLLRDAQRTVAGRRTDLNFSDKKDNFEKTRPFARTTPLHLS